MKFTERHHIYRCFAGLFACCVLMLCLSACDRNSHDEFEPEDPHARYPISLSASSEDMRSRALVTNETTLQATNLGVFAYKKVADKDPVLVFNNVELEYTDGAWTYSPLKYWDRTAEYFFVSYSPYNASTSYNSNTQELVINNIPNWQEIGDNVIDYVVANSYGSAEGDYITPNGIQPVQLPFSHILSQLEVRVVKNAFLLSEYTLKGVSYANVPVKEIDGSPATSVYSHPNGNNNNEATSAAASSWKQDINSGEAISISGEAISMRSGSAAITNTPSDGTTLKHLVVPFSCGESSIQITIDYAIGGTDQEAKTVSTSLQQLNAGEKYVLTLTFESGTNIVPSLSIEAWTDVEVEEPKYNW